MHEELHRAELLRVLLEDADELLTDDDPLALWILHTLKAREESLRRVDVHQTQARTERRDDLFRLARTQKAVVDEDAREAIADRLGHERRRHRGVDATRQRADRVTVADDATQLRDRFLDERGRRPVALAAAHAVQEIPQHLGAARRVHDLGMELDREAIAAVAHRREREALGGRDAVESGWHALHRVAMAHPRALVRAEALE